MHLTEFTLFVQLMNRKNNSCKFIFKNTKSISKRITCNLKISQLFFKISFRQKSIPKFKLHNRYCHTCHQMLNLQQNWTNYTNCHVGVGGCGARKRSKSSLWKNGPEMPVDLSLFLDYDYLEFLAIIETHFYFLTDLVKFLSSSTKFNLHILL